MAHFYTGQHSWVDRLRRKNGPAPNPRPLGIETCALLLCYNYCQPGPNGSDLSFSDFFHGAPCDDPHLLPDSDTTSTSTTTTTTTSLSPSMEKETGATYLHKLPNLSDGLGPNSCSKRNRCRVISSALTHGMLRLLARVKTIFPLAEFVPNCQPRFQTNAMFALPVFLFWWWKHIMNGCFEILAPQLLMCLVVAVARRDSPDIGGVPAMPLPPIILLLKLQIKLNHPYLNQCRTCIGTWISS